MRECLSTTVLPVGGGVDGKSPLLVEKGDLIESNFRAQHRDKLFWGDDADEFIQSDGLKSGLPGSVFHFLVDQEFARISNLYTPNASI